MIKLRKYFKGHTRMYIHGTVKNKEVTFRGTLGDPEWVSEDIDLPNHIALQREELNEIITGAVCHVLYCLSEIDKDGKIRGNYIISRKDIITQEPPQNVDINPGPFFCLVIDGTEYWREDIMANFGRIQSRINDYNTELYLKEIDDESDTLQGYIL